MIFNTKPTFYTTQHRTVRAGIGAHLATLKSLALTGGVMIAIGIAVVSVYAQSH